MTHAPDAMPLLVAQLGTVPYTQALELQRAAARARIEGRLTADLLILLEHPPVITLGRSSHTENLLFSGDALAARGVELAEVERGGDVTFHGPGQLVGYPIVDLKEHRRDLHWYLRQVEEALIRAAAQYGLPATRNPGQTGVWTAGRGMGGPALRAPLSAPAGPSGEVGPAPPRDATPAATVLPGAPQPAEATAEPAAVAPSAHHPPLRKLASIGVHAREWVTWHGFALNVTTDLSYFDLIVPCGITGVEMTSLARELGLTDLTVAGVATTVAHAFGEVFQRRVVFADPESLDFLRAG